jgi:ribonuclease HI
MKILNVYTDGGARGNPGPSAIGVYIIDDKNNQVVGFGNTIGEATNNVAEYKAIIAGLDWILENQKQFSKLEKIYFYMDSRLACSQIIGIFKVKNAVLRELLLQVRDREAQINIPIYYKNIPREQNLRADEFVNKALDEEISVL